MSRKFLFALATTATIAVSGLASSAANAHGFGGGGHFGGGHFGRMSGGFGHFGHSSFYRPGRWGHWNHWSHWNHWNHWNHYGYYHRWYWPGYRWYGGDGGYQESPAPIAAAVSGAPVSGPAASGPCTCLTKTYTQDGLVVFADLCTKESAAAPVNGRAADATPAPQGPSAPP